jgi:hypothetical protein
VRSFRLTNARARLASSSEIPEADGFVVACGYPVGHWLLGIAFSPAARRGFWFAAHVLAALRRALALIRASLSM